MERGEGKEMGIREGGEKDSLRHVHSFFRLGFVHEK